MFRLEVLVDEAARRAALCRDARDGLTRTPKRVRSRWIWDEHGSALFEAITRLPEYYLTRCELELLAAHAGGVAQLAPAETVIELGSGASEKTALLLDALLERRALRRFVALDVSEPALRAAGPRIVTRYPDIEVVAVVGDLEEHLPAVPGDGRRLVAFLGSTIGALEPEERAAFL